jgi:hypothetical protein
MAVSAMNLSMLVDPYELQNISCPDEGRGLFVLISSLFTNLVNSTFVLLPFSSGAALRASPPSANATYQSIKSDPLCSAEVPSDYVVVG